MRIYLPSTVAKLRRALADGSVAPVSGIGFGVTDPLRAEYPAGDEEELEYLAMSDAARASLRLLAAGAPGQDVVNGPSLRVVIAADVPGVQPYPAGDRAALKIDAPVPWADVAAVHIDGADASDAVLAAVAAVDAADLDDADAEFVVGEADSYELAWYAPGEVAFLLQGFG